MPEARGKALSECTCLSCQSTRGVTVGAAGAGAYARGGPDAELPSLQGLVSNSCVGLRVPCRVFSCFPGLYLPEAGTRDPTHDKVMRRRPDKQGRSGLEGFRKAAPALTLKVTSVFLMLAVLDCSLISVTWVEGLPWSLSKQDQLRTLINMSPGRWHPIRLSRMKGVFQFRPLCWHFSLFGKCVYALGTNRHDCS